MALGFVHGTEMLCATRSAARKPRQGRHSLARVRQPLERAKRRRKPRRGDIRVANRRQILIALVVAEFVLPTTALESLRHALAEKFLQLDTFLSALLLRFRGENVLAFSSRRLPIHGRPPARS